MYPVITRLWREPLLHFLLIGAALFVYYGLAGNRVEVAPKRIHVDRGQQQQLADGLQRTWSRPPTRQEFEAIVDSHVRDEVFYREALAMGLDRDDPMVRRRLRMKLEFILEDLTQQEIGDGELEAYLQQNADAFRRPPLVSFRQVYLDPERHPDLPADAARLLTELNGGADADDLGDPTLLPRNFQQAPQSLVERSFGGDFAAAVVALPAGAWQGPVYSPFGAHLVRVDERVDARLPQLAEIRGDVLREYRAQQVRQQKDLAYQKLREGYEISIEPLDVEPAALLSGDQAGDTR